MPHSSSPPYPPARGCDVQLNAWCDANCPHFAEFGSLLARYDGMLAHMSEPRSAWQRAWRCYARVTLDESGLRYTGGRAYCTRDLHLRQVLETCLIKEGRDTESVAPSRPAAEPPSQSPGKQRRSPAPPYAPVPSPSPRPMASAIPSPSAVGVGAVGQVTQLASHQSGDSRSNGDGADIRSSADSADAHRQDTRRSGDRTGEDSSNDRNDRGATGSTDGSVQPDEGGSEGDAHHYSNVGFSGHERDENDGASEELSGTAGCKGGDRHECDDRRGGASKVRTAPSDEVPAGRVPRIGLVVAHCHEHMEWLRDMQRGLRQGAGGSLVSACRLFASLLHLVRCGGCRGGSHARRNLFISPSRCQSHREISVPAAAPCACEPQAKRMPRLRHVHAFAMRRA